jgi:tellurite resistance protein
VAHGIRDPVAKAFQEIHPDNPLRELNPSERKYLWALLFFADTVMSPGGGDVIFKELDRMSKIVSDAAKLSAKLKSQIFGGTSSEALRPFTVGFEDLPARLTEFSEILGEVLDSTGKRGHKKKALATKYIVQASEFVWMRTGHHYDEHLAELLQPIRKRAEFDDFSGDAIRKRRENLKEHYPMLYASALRRARIQCEKSISSASS